VEAIRSQPTDVEVSGRQLLDVLDALSADLADEPGDDEVAPASGGSPAAQENRTIRAARSSLARKRSLMLQERVEQARRHAQDLLAARRVGQSVTDPLVSPVSSVSSVSSGGEVEEVGDVLRVVMLEAARRFNRTRTASTTAEEMLQAIVAGALHAIPHVSAASITLVDRAGVITTHAPSSELVAAVDRVQVELRQGPCIDALDEAHTTMTHASDLAADPPWPEFAARALETGFHEVLSFQLVADGTAGALNLYADAPHRFDAQDELVGALLADQAAVALAGARRVGQLNKALETRDLIGRAKGILMERFGLVDARAFEMLVDSSQQTNMKLVAVAEWLVRETEAGRSGR